MSSTLKQLYYFKPEAASGEEFAEPSGSLSTDRSYHTSGLLSDGKVGIVGGNDDQSASKKLDIFDPATETVVAGPNLAQSRSGPSGTSLDGKFYVCGHYNGNNDAGGKQCEVYDPALNSWQSIASAQFNHDYTDLGKQATSARETDSEVDS